MRMLLIAMLAAMAACGENDAALNHSNVYPFVGRWLPDTHNGTPKYFNREVFVEFLADGKFYNQYGKGAWVAWHGTNTIVVTQRDHNGHFIPIYRCKWQVADGRLTLIYITEWDSWSVGYIPDPG